MYIYFSKMLPSLILPVGIVIELCVLALLFQLWGKRKTSTALISCALLVLWVSSTPIVASTLYGKLERAYPPLQMADIPARKCIVLLGGSLGPVLPPRVDFELYESVDRVRTAARLQLEGKGGLILVMAGNRPRSPLGQSEPEATKILLGEWGVPAKAVILDGSSHNTRENALNAAVLLEKWSCGLPLLVTSAAHMKRSVAAFRKIGVEVFPVSTDVRFTKNDHITAHDWIPNSLSLRYTSNAIREWMGQKIYEFKGWN